MENTENVFSHASTSKNIYANYLSLSFDQYKTNNVENIKNEETLLQPQPEILPEQPDLYEDVEALEVHQPAPRPARQARAPARARAPAQLPAPARARAPAQARSAARARAPAQATAPFATTKPRTPQQKNPRGL